jgi:hypothetical protein
MRRNSIPLLITAACTVAGAIVLARASASATSSAQQLQFSAFLPLSVAKFDLTSAGGVGHPEPTAPPHQTAVPSATAEQPGSTPQPTLAPDIEHSYDARDIILQLGDVGGGGPDTTVGEETGAVPWLTLYGDGTIIVQREDVVATDPYEITLYDMFTTRMRETDVQAMLAALVYEVEVFTLRDYYSHPDVSGYPTTYIYLSADRRTKRFGVQGLDAYRVRRPSRPEPDLDKLKALVQVIARLKERYVVVPENKYVPDKVMLIVQVCRLLNCPREAPPYPLGHPLKSIYDQAPPAASDYTRNMPGHRMLRGEDALKFRAEIRKEAVKYWPPEVVAAYRVGRDIYAVGARDEVPGGAKFLPPDKESWLYREP